MFLQLGLQGMLDNFVYGFDLTVCLRMADRGEAFLNPQFVTKFSKLLAIELSAIVRHYHLGNPKSADN